MSIEKTITSKYKWIIWVKVIVLILSCWLIYQKITDPEQFGEEFLNVITSAIDSSAVLILLAVILLMPFNWLLEALKWKLLARPHSAISTREAFQGVMSGLSLGFITPHGVGDYAGRLLSLSGESRSKLIGSVWLGRAMQMMVTGLFGMVGVWMFMKMSSFGNLSINSWWWIILFVIILFVVVLYRSKIKIFGESIKYYFSMIGAYRSQDYLQLFVLSLVRYLVFSIQFLLILNVFEIPLGVFTLFAGMSWMFLMKSIIPSFNFLSDLGVRELSVLTFFDLYNVSQPAVLTSSLLLWLINILLPVLVGLYFVFKLKINSQR